MIDISTFRSERERLRRFCFYRTSASIVIRDVVSQNRVKDPRDDLVLRLAELLQFLLLVDPRRFADPDDTCANFGPSIIAFPTMDARNDVATILAVTNNTFEAIVVDYRISEVLLPLFAPNLSCSDKMKTVKTWDQVLRKQRRIAALLTVDPTTDEVAIRCDGSRMLRRSGGETFDIAGRFWRDACNQIKLQRCMTIEA